VTAVYYQGSGQFTVGPGEVRPPTGGEVRLDVAYCGLCGTDLHIGRGDMDARVKTPQVIGHEMAGTIAEIGTGVEGLAAGDKVVVRPLDSRGETAADKGISHICRDLKFLGIDTPGAFQSSWTVPAFTIHRFPPDTDLKLAALTEPLAVACHDVRRARVEVLGTRVYEPEDYEKAIDLLVGGRLPLADLITSVEPLQRMPAALEQLEHNPSAMKILVDCRT
jgi:(R,R)-butanediol dehydrogenase / meso-butanediol dehydrogenase / diacetyl reductase